MLAADEIMMPKSFGHDLVRDARLALDAAHMRRRDDKARADASSRCHGRAEISEVISR